jgi:hypothetical protein
MRWSALLVFYLSGCTFFSKGQTHAEYSRSAGAPVMTVAARPGRYALYVGEDPITCAVFVLKKGEPFGFERNDDGRIRAVAGAYSTTLPRSVTNARWMPVAKRVY